MLHQMLALDAFMLTNKILSAGHLRPSIAFRHASTFLAPNFKVCFVPPLRQDSVRPNTFSASATLLLHLTFLFPALLDFAQFRVHGLIYFLDDMPCVKSDTM